MVRLVLLQPALITSPCIACKALYGLTCCEQKTDDPLFPMTYGEASRIAKVTGQAIEDAVDVLPVAKELRTWWLKFSPEHADLIAGGTGLYLPMDNKQCRYLGPGGCTIPQVKPSTCALFPFSKVGNGWMVGQLVQTTGFCIGQDYNDCDFGKTLEAFGETVAHLEAIVRRRDRDIRVHVAQMRKLKRKR
jgi:Fe-S-cluster containining protein